MRLMLSGVAVAALACGATAAPPRGPLSEGREPDPVAREYYHGAPPAPPVERAAPAREPQQPGKFGEEHGKNHWH